MYWSHADVMTYRIWFERAGLMIEAEGSEPRNGNPGYAVLIARTPPIDEQHREVALGSGSREPAGSLVRRPKAGTYDSSAP